MESPVRYVRSRDGTRIAYRVAGEGAALVHLQVQSVSHVELYPRLPGASEYLGSLGRGRQLIEMDFRGTGMSDRDCEDHSVDALTDDVEAVLDDLRVDRFDITAGGARVSPALGLAVRRPEAVGRIVLGYPFNVRPPVADGAEKAPFSSLMESNWELYLETAMLRNTGRPISEIQDVLAFVRRCFDQKNAVATLNAWQPGEDWARAGQIECPVLVVEFVGNVHIQPGLMQAFAREFRHGTYIALPETVMAPPYGANPEPFLQALHEFMGPPPESAVHPSDPLTAREREVLRMLVAGKTQHEIAEALVISPSTASRHISNLYEKIGAHRRADAVAWAFRHGMD